MLYIHIYIERRRNETLQLQMAGKERKRGLSESSEEEEGSLEKVRIAVSQKLTPLNY